MPDPRTLASHLLLATGLAHVIHAGVLGLSGEALPLAGFGLAYAAIGVWLRRPGKGAAIAGVVVPAVGGLGGAAGLAEGVDPVMLVYVLVDAAVIGLCVHGLVGAAKLADVEGSTE